MTKRRLLQINSVINSGSTGRIAEDIGKKVMEKGWESYIAYGRNDRASKSYKLEIGHNCDVIWHGLQTRLFDKHGFASKRATKELVRNIRQLKPDIIHLHNLHGYYLNIEILFNYLASTQIPIVWTLHDCWPFTGHCAHFMFYNCNKWKIHCEKCPAKKSYPSSLFLDRSYRNYEIKKNLFTSIENLTLITVSNWLHSIVKESFLKFSNIHTIYNGIDTTVFFPRSTTSIEKRINTSDKFVILGVSNVWIPKKGLNDFIKLSNLLKEDEIIVMIGINDEIKKHLPPNIITFPKTENIEQLADFYSIADVLLNLSWEDNFPTINLESLACGTPVITYRTGGSPESITAETGFVTEQGDLLELRDAIDILKKNGRSTYSTACRQRALTYFNKEDRYDDYVDIYEKMLLK